MYFVNWATLIDYIDDKSHKMDLKSSRNYSTNHLKVKIMPLVIYGLGGIHTHTQTFVH